MKSAKDRLVSTAADLFYRRGLPNVGINEVTDTSNVARMTLYNHFESKEHLAATAFDELSNQRLESLEKELQRRRSMYSKIDAFFYVAEQLSKKDNFCGCAFINVALQIPDAKGQLHAQTKLHKLKIKALIINSLAGMSTANKELLATQILVLWDGCIVESYIQQSTKPIKAAKRAAQTLIAAFDNGNS